MGARRMTIAPLIGLPTSELRRSRDEIPDSKDSAPPYPEVALAIPYLRSIEEAGGIPVVLPPADPRFAETVIGRLDGLCLPGGPDVDPSSYDAEPHPQLGQTSPEADRWEIALARAALGAHLPTFAICRGMQVLNVALGGTLRQHLPDDPAAVEHRQDHPGTEVAHPIEVVEGTLVAALLGGTDCEVNTFHHQAIDRLGNGLVVTAWADDGVIEAVETTEDAPILGVQWHAETLTHSPAHARLFAWLVDSATDRATVRATVFS